MKRNYVFISIGAALLLLLSASSCGNLQLPETVSVKTNARFQAPLGTAKLDITEKLSSDMIREKIQEALGDDASVYTYAKDGNDDVLRYLIHAPVPILPIDIKAYLDGMDFNANVEALDEVVEFKAGDPVTASETITFSVSEITNQLEDSGTFEPGSGTSVHEGNWEVSSLYLPEVNVVNGSADLSYDRIYYADGSVQITMNRPNSDPEPSSGYALNMTAYLVPFTFDRATGNLETEYIARSNNGNPQNIITNPTLTIPLNVPAGIPMKFKFVFVAQSSGGNPSTAHTYIPSASYRNLRVKRITGLNTSASGLSLGDETVDLDLSAVPAAFKQIEFDNATVNVRSGNLSGWSGVSINFASADDLKFTGPGLVSGSITSTSSSSSGYLINKTYTAAATIRPQAGSVSVYAKPTLSLSNATIDFGEDGNSNQSINASVSFSLNTIKEANVDLRELGIQTIQLPTDGSSGSIELPDELLKFVNKISFTNNKTDEHGNSTSTPRKGFGLKCKVTNTLPAGNDITFNMQILTSGGSGYERSVTIPAGSNATERDWTQKGFDLKFPAYEEGVTKYLDLTAEIDGAEDFTFHNLVLGNTYNLGISEPEFVYDWDSVSLNLSGAGLNLKDEMPLPFDLSSLMENMAIIGDEIRKIEVHEFPFYLYARTPSATSALESLFGSIGLNGKLYIKFKEGENDKYLNLFGDGEISDTEPSGSNITFKSDIPWPTDVNALVVGNESDPNNIAYYMKPENASVSTDLKNILSLMGGGTATDLNLNYDIGLQNANNITVYQSMMPTSDTDAAINMSVDIVTVLSFDFGLKAPVSADIMSLMDEHYNEPGEDGMYKDLLNRSNISSDSEYQKYINAIKEVGINYQLVNELFINDDAHKMEFMVKIVDLAEADGYTGLNKVFPLNQGKDKITFSGTEIQNIMTHRFHPNIVLNLGRPLVEGETETTGYLSNKSRLSVSRSGLANRDALSANVIVYVQMNGDEPIQVWGGQE